MERGKRGEIKGAGSVDLSRLMFEKYEGFNDGSMQVL